MKYLILTQPSTAYADHISEEIWNIRYPQSVRRGNETTTKYCGHIVHPSSNNVALAFPDEVLQVHPQASFQALIDLISPEGHPLRDSNTAHFDNLMPRDENDPPMTIDVVLPPEYADNLKDKQFMADNGWFSGGP